MSLWDLRLQNFEPKRATKNFILWLKKKPVHVGGIEHPGLFDDYGFTMTALGFIILGVLEVIGLYALMAALAENTDMELPTIVLMVLSAFLLDCILAIGHHVFAAGNSVVLRMELILADLRYELEGGQTPDVRRADLSSRLGRRKLFANLFAMLLVLLAGAKIGGFITFNPDPFDEIGKVMFIIVSYLCVAILHVMVTGHFGSEMLYRVLHRGPDERAYRVGECGAVVRAQLLPWHETYAQDCPIQVSQHAVVVEQQDDGTQQAVLRATGVLRDSQLLEMANRVHAVAAKREIFTRGMLLQMQILQSDAGPATT